MTYCKLFMSLLQLICLHSSLPTVSTKADSKQSLIVKYIQVICVDTLRLSHEAGDLGAKYGGDITEYELRWEKIDLHIDK